MLLSVIKFLLKIILIYLPLFIIFLYILISILKLKFIINYRFNKYINIFNCDIFLGPIKIYKIHTDFKDADRNKKTSVVKRRSAFETIKAIYYIIREIDVKNVGLLSTKINFGAGEAHYTAILSGIIYAILGSAYGIINHHYKVDKNILNIKYFFNDIKFELDFDCIVRAKGANIIKVIDKIYIPKLKRKTEGKKNERTSYSGTYDHSNAKYQ